MAESRRARALHTPYATLVEPGSARTDDARQQSAFSIPNLDFMSLRILIVPDKFKGSLTAAGAATAIAEGWGKVRPQDQLTLLPMSDGGDGFGEVMSALLGGKPRVAKTLDAAHRPCAARWWWVADRRIAIIETARVVGLAMLPRGKFHPFTLDTYGLGVVFKAAIRYGAAQCLVGLGGSATNDAGFGLARSLGWQFFDSKQQTIEQWPDLARLKRIEKPQKPHLFPKVQAAVDVQNLLLGRRGATRI